MEKVIRIEYPESLANSLKMSAKDFEREIKTSSLVKLYELGKISSGIAAKTLGISRLDFLDLLGTYKVSLFGQHDVSELNDDVLNA